LVPSYQRAHMPGPDTNTDAEAHIRTIAHTHAHTFINTHTHTHTHSHTFTHTQMVAYSNSMQLLAPFYQRAHIPGPDTNTDAKAHMCTLTHTHAHTFINTHALSYTHARKNIVT